MVGFVTVVGSLITGNLLHPRTNQTTSGGEVRKPVDTDRARANAAAQVDWTYHHQPRAEWAIDCIQGAVSPIYEDLRSRHGATRRRAGHWCKPGVG